MKTATIPADPRPPQAVLRAQLDTAQVAVTEAQAELTLAREAGITTHARLCAVRAAREAGLLRPSDPELAQAEEAEGAARIRLLGARSWLAEMEGAAVTARNRLCERRVLAQGPYLADALAKEEEALSRAEADSGVLGTTFSRAAVLSVQSRLFNIRQQIDEACRHAPPDAEQWAG